jgi:hypothetical protein
MVNRRGLTSKIWLLFTSCFDLRNCLNVITDLPGSQSAVPPPFLNSEEAGMTVIELRSIQSDPAVRSPKTIVDLIDALDHQVLFAKGIADAIRGTEEFVGDPCCLDGPTALIAEHIEKLSKIATELNALRNAAL